MLAMPGSRQRGFTLVELMVVLAMIAILSAMAVAYTGERRANLRGFAGSIVGEADAARLRALASRKWQRIGFDLDAGKMITEQATTTGMAEPDDWTVQGVYAIPGRFTVASIHDSADANGGEDVIEGAGVDEYLMFAPDGSSVPRTIYLSSTQPFTYVRVVVYRATGTAYVKENW